MPDTKRVQILKLAKRSGVLRPRDLERAGISGEYLNRLHSEGLLACQFEFDGSLLARAIAATFDRRRTDIPQAVPLALTAEFATDRTKATQWRAFLNRSKLAPQNSDFGEVIELLRAFLMPPTEALSGGSQFPAYWPPTGPWQLDSVRSW